jgi:energy-coupling factor transporter transmembrane protein EcfT
MIATRSGSGEERSQTALPSPGARLVAAFSSVVAVAVAPGADPLRYAAFAVLFLSLSVLFRLRPIPLLRRFLFLIPLLLVLAAAAILGGAGARPAAAAGDLAAKSFLAFFAAAVTAGPLGPVRLIEGFQELRFPATAAAVFSSGMRFLTILAAEGTRVKRAREARSTRREGLRQRLGFAKALVPRLFDRALTRSERTYGAMLARGFDGRLRSLSGAAGDRGQADCSGGPARRGVGNAAFLAALHILLGIIVFAP